MRHRLIHRWFLGLAIFATALVLAGTDASAAKKQRAHDKFYEHALELIAKGDRKGAIIELKNALQADTKDLAARVLLGNTYLEVEDGASAAKEFLQARKNGAQDSFILAPLGRAYVLQGLYRKALKELGGVGQKRTTAAEIAVIRGDAYFALQEYGNAEKSFTAASKIRPNSAKALTGLARIKIATDDLTGAKRYAKWAVEANPKESEAWFVKGEIARLQRKHDEALRDYDRAVELTPRFGRALVARAGIKIDLGRHAEAEPDLLRVRKANPRNPRAAYLYALVLARRGEVKDAQRALVQAENILKTYPAKYVNSDSATQLLAGVVGYFRRDFDTAYSHLSGYLKRFPQHLGARKLLASIALWRGEVDYAIFLLEKIVPYVPEDVEVLTMLGDALMRAKRYREATKILEKAAVTATPGSSTLSKLVALQLLAGRDAQAIGMLKSEMKRDSDAVGAALMLSATQLKNGAFKDALATANSVIEQQPNIAAAHNFAAGAQLGLKDIEGARDNFRAAIEIFPAYLEAMFNLAKLETRLGNLDDAEELYSSILDKDPKNGEAMMAMADLDRRRDDLDDAVRWLEKARALSSTPHVAGLHLVDLYIAAKRADTALSVARSLHSAKPKNLFYLMAVGRARLAGRQIQKAAQTFKDVATRAGERKSPEWLHRAATWQLRALDKQGGKESLQKALSINDRYLPAHIALFRLEMEANKFDAAMARARKVTIISSGAAIGNELQGDVHMRRHKYDSAIRLYDIALKKRPSSVLAIKAYRARRVGGGDAMAFAKKWAGGHPNESTAHRLLASAYADAGRDDQAIEIYDLLLDTAPKDVGLLNNLALIYQKQDESRALDYAERAFDAAPENPAVMDTYGWILVQQGSMDRGLALLRNAKLRAPGVLEIYYHLAVALTKLGKKEEARRELRAALQSGELFEGIADARKLSARLTPTRR